MYATSFRLKVKIHNTNDKPKPGNTPNFGSSYLTGMGFSWYE